MGVEFRKRGVDEGLPKISVVIPLTHGGIFHVLLTTSTLTTSVSLQRQH